MRLLSLLTTALLAPSALAAQGTIIPRPRPCPPPPPPCRADRCPPPPVCGVPSGSVIQRTSSQVRVELRDRVLRYQIDETFRNRGGLIGEADYIFPMPSGAAFEALELEIDGELVSGETMGADQARRIYEDIVRRHRDPALVEYMGRGLLRTRIFPIQPGEEKRVVVRFQTVAEREGGALRVDYTRAGAPSHAPVSIAMPRVVPVDGDRAQGGDRAGPERGEESGNLFTLSYPRSNDYGRPYSPTHSLGVEERRGTQVVTATGDAPQVTILIPLRRATAASIAMLPHAPGREDGFALLTITPPAAAPRTTPRDVSFVVDVSGSMRGRKMEQAREAGKQLLASLSPEDRFRIIDFSTDVRSFAPAYAPATRRNIADAERYLDDLRADGSTNISGALEHALDTSTDGERMPIVFFVTDGEPTVGERNPDAIAALAQRLRGRARVFTFGVGADVNVPLVEHLALDGRGLAHFVRPEESVERAVRIVASRITSPVVTDVRVRAEGVRLTRLHPSLPADIFAGQDLVLFARYAGSGSARIIVEGQTAAGPVRWTERVTFPDHDRGNSFVARLWATQRAGWLSAERRRNGASPELDEELRELGTRYGIPTELSSYLVLEPGMRVAASQPQEVHVQVNRGPKAEIHRMTRPDAANAARDEADFTGRGVAGGTAAGGRASGTQPPAAPAAARERQFEMAKSAAELRSVTSLADTAATATVDAAGVAVRRVGTRTFTLANGSWTDARFTSTMATVRVKPYSAAYFTVLERMEELRAPFALMGRDGTPGVIVAGRSVAVAVAADGRETLSASELASLEARW